MLMVDRCGSAEGLDAGRHCLTKWGFRRAEDICWIKTNRDPSRKATSTIRQDAQAVLQHTKVSRFRPTDAWNQSSASFGGCTLPQRLCMAYSEDFAAAATLPGG